MHTLIIFASGRGSNAKAIIDYFKINRKAHISLVVSNKAEAGVLKTATEEGIETLLINQESFNDDNLIQKMQSHKPAFIILAGFLWKIPDAIIQAFAGRIINIHPALLPKYGGKGMYGHNVHDAVLAASENESGITIHYVNEVYDSGNIILQARCGIEPGDTVETLAARIHSLEHFFYPRTIEFLLDNSPGNN